MFVSPTINFKIFKYTYVILIDTNLVTGIFLGVVAVGALYHMWPIIAGCIVGYIIVRRNHPHECIVITLLAHWYYGASLFYVLVWFIYHRVCLCAWRVCRIVPQCHTIYQIRDETRRIMQETTQYDPQPTIVCWLGQPWNKLCVNLIHDGARPNPH